MAGHEVFVGINPIILVCHVCEFQFWITTNDIDGQNGDWLNFVVPMFLFRCRFVVNVEDRLSVTGWILLFIITFFWKKE